MNYYLVGQKLLLTVTCLHNYPLTQNFPFLALKTNLLKCITALLLINEQFVTRILAIFVELKTFKTWLSLPDLGGRADPQRFFLDNV